MDAATGPTAGGLEELGDHRAAKALLEEAIARHDAWLVHTVPRAGPLRPRASRSHLKRAPLGGTVSMNAPIR